MHGADATLGPHGPYTECPPKATTEIDEVDVPGALVRAPASEGGDDKDPITRETLTPL
jgi:hypothetical protein